MWPVERNRGTLRAPNMTMNSRWHNLALAAALCASAASCDGSGASHASTADAATSSGADAGRDAGGKLTCSERDTAAADVVGRALDSADLHCSQASDCERIDIDTACHAACGAVVSKTGKASVVAAIAAQDLGSCKTFAADGCKRIAPPCIPPLPFACVAGRCSEVELGQDAGP